MMFTGKGHATTVLGEEVAGVEGKDVPEGTRGPGIKSAYNKCKRVWGMQLKW